MIENICMERSIMKKYIGVYVILYAIILFLFLTGGVSQGIIIDEYDLGHTADGVKGETIFLVYNVIISLSCLVASIITVCLKGNRIRHKWIIPVVMIILIVLFLPIVYKWQIGGITGRPYEDYYTLIEYSKL
jgi:multisubunit Na+/H+ antiporter MnhC subunit